MTRLRLLGGWVRELMWLRALEMVKTGRAIMVYTANNEQGLAFKVHKHNWAPADFEGINLILRPALGTTTTDADESLQKGWSNASKRCRYGRQ